MVLLRRAATHRATTRHLQSVYPGIPSGQGFARGVYIGRDRHGGSFTYDPWELYQAGVITNPNMLVIGQLGRGKSALVKTYVFRQLAFGRQALMLDPKGENGALCEAAGVGAIALRPGGGTAGVRLNPLDLGRLADPQTRTLERTRVIAAICGVSLGVRSRPMSGSPSSSPSPPPPRASPGPRRRSEVSSMRCSPPPMTRRRPPAPPPSSSPPAHAAVRWSSAAWSTATCGGCSTGRPLRRSTSRHRW